MAISTTDPRTGEVLKTFDELTDDQLEDRLARAAAAADSYRLTTHEERCRVAAGGRRHPRQADRRDRRADDARDGQDQKASAAEVGKCAAVLRYYAEHGAELPGRRAGRRRQRSTRPRPTPRYLPLGAVLAVMPWNFPLWQVMRFAAPALMAGNVGLLKHASNVPQTALFMEELFRDAGFPAGVFQTLLIGSGKVDGVLRDDRVAAATLTGSEAAGRRGRARPPARCSRRSCSSSAAPTRSW